MTDPSAAETPLPLEEALRVIGQVLEAARAPALSLTIEAAGVSFAGGSIGHRRYDWAELPGLVRAYRAQRRPQPVFRPWLDPWRGTWWSVWLRITGRVLDALEIRTCRLEARLGATLEEHRLKVWVAGDQVLDETVVSRSLAAAWMEQDLLQPDAPPPLPQRPWWRRFYPTAGRRPPEPLPPEPPPDSPAASPPEPPAAREITWARWSELRPQDTWRGIHRR